MLRVGIVGGGISGLATAVALRAAGHTAEVYERASVLREVGSGLTLWSNATRALQSMGLLLPVLERGQPIRQFALRERTGHLLMNIPIEHFGTAAIAVHRYDLQAALLSAVPKADIHTSVQVHTVRSSPEGVYLQGASGTLDCGPFDLLVGADGVRSAVRNYVLKADRALRYQGYTIWRGVALAADLALKIDPATGISETWGRGQRFGILPMGQGRICWYATANALTPVAGTTPDARGEERKAELLRLFATWHRPIPELIRATDGATIAEHAAYDRASVPGWSRGATLLIGDAAHPLTPNLGQGGCMALEDAVVLGKLMQGVDSAVGVEAAVKKFEALRFQRVEAMVRRCRLLGALGQWEHPVMAYLRNHVAALIPGVVFAHTSRSIQSYAADQIAS